jgi:hypothetical protein
MPGETEQAVAWTWNPLRERPLGPAIVVALVAAVGAGAWSLSHTALFAAALAAGALGSLAELVVPSRYRLDASGARSSVGPARAEIAWQQVRRVACDGRGLLLTSLPRASRMDRFRGVYLRYGREMDGERVRNVALALRAAACSGTEAIQSRSPAEAG